MVSFAKHEGGVDVNVSRRGIDRTESAAGTGVLVCSQATLAPHPPKRSPAVSSHTPTIRQPSEPSLRLLFQ